MRSNNKISTVKGKNPSTINKDEKMVVRIVESNHLHSVGYDVENKTLQIVFNYNKTRRYIYRKVTPYIYTQLMQAESKGEYFADKIKNRFEFDIR